MRRDLIWNLGEAMHVFHSNRYSLARRKRPMDLCEPCARLPRPYRGVSLIVSNDIFQSIAAGFLPVTVNLKAKFPGAVTLILPRSSTW